MSEENIEVVRRIFAAQSRRDIDAVYAHYHPDLVWEDSGALWGDWGTVRGLDELRSTWHRWAEAMVNARFDVKDLVDAGPDVVGTVRISAESRGTGLQLEQNVGMVWTVEGGLVTRVRAYRSRADALLAAGIDE